MSVIDQSSRVITLAGIDIETTGLLEPEHRIIEIYIGLWRAGKRVFEFEERIDPQRSIPAESQRIHGISSADVIGKPTWDVVGPHVRKVLSVADCFIWHNGDEFDGPFLEMELKRIGLELPKKPAVDTMKEGVWATPDGKKPRLEELCFACGVPYDKDEAHAAPYDVNVMMQSYYRGVDWSFFRAPPVGSLQTAA